MQITTNIIHLKSTLPVIRMNEFLILRCVALLNRHDIHVIHFTEKEITKLALLQYTT